MFIKIVKLITHYQLHLKNKIKCKHVPTIKSAGLKRSALLYGIRESEILCFAQRKDEMGW